jgi:predicted DNA-binding ribbon-helix-helix protein
VRLEEAFWVGLREIAHRRRVTLSALMSTIDAQRHHMNRSSALYRADADTGVSEPPSIDGSFQVDSDSLAEVDLLLSRARL